MKLPFSLDEFRNPSLAIERYGLALALQKYLSDVEPLYIENGLPGQPKDWEWRKIYIFQRERGICRDCGRKNPRLWDAHHVMPRGKGGNHSLSNLVLLCRTCHNEQHPEKHKHRQDSTA